MMVQETKRQVQEFLSQPDAATRLAWLEQFQKAATTTEVPETSTEEESRLIVLAQALKAEVKLAMRDDPPQAQEIAQLIQEVATWSGEPEIQAIADWSWGNAHIYEGHHKACINRYQSALCYYETTDQQVAIVDLHINCAGAYSNMDAYEEALLHLQEAQNKIDSHTDSDAAISLEIVIAVTYGYLDRYEEAIEATKRGIALAQAYGYPALEGRLLINQGLALEGLGHFDEAVAVLEKAQQILAFHDEQLDEGTAWVNLGMVRTRRGEYRQALLDLDRARRRFEALGNTMEVAMVDLRRAQTSLELNLLSETIALCETSQPILQEKHDVQRYGIAASCYLGIAYSRLGESELAQQYLDQASQDLHALGTPIQEAAAHLARARLMANLPSQETLSLPENHRQSDLAELEEAEAIAQTASDLFQAQKQTLRYLEARIVLGDIQRQRLADVDSLTRANENYQAVLASLKQSGSSTLRYRAYYGLGKLAETQNAIEDALDWYDQAIQAIADTLLMLGESELRGGYLYDKLAIFQSAITLNLTQGNYDEVLRLIELARVGSWQPSAEDDVDSPELTELSELTPQQLEAEIDDLSRQWRWYYQKLYGGSSSAPDLEATRSDIVHLREERYDQKIMDLEAKIKQAMRVKRLYDSQTQLAPTLSDLSLENLRQQLQPTQCMLVYYVLDSQVIVLLLTAEKTISRTLMASRSDIFDDLKRLHFTLRRSHPNTDKFLQDLWEKLFKPLLPHIQEGSELIIVPHDQLYHLPFHALYDGEQYLLQRYQIHYMPLISWVLQEDRQGWKPLELEQPTALIMAYSDRDSQNSIPGTLAEANAIEQIWQNSMERGRPSALEPKLYLEEEAVSSHLNAYAPDGHLFHLATHGKFDTENPLFSTLLLADGPLSLADVEMLRFKASPLIILSACETGINNINKYNAGVQSISQAFLHAGASMVLVSLWRVADQATALLMQSFHYHLANNHSPSQALHQAQSEMINNPQYAHPTYWAGWTLIG